MSASVEIFNALVAGGMSSAQAMKLVAQSAAEIHGTVNQKTTAAVRQQRYRDRKASQSVTQRNAETGPTVTNRNESVTPHERNEPSQTVTERNESVTRDAERPSYIEDKKEGSPTESKNKKERVSKKRNGPLPGTWVPPARAVAIAAELGLPIQPIEDRFRDYLASKGVTYADYDAAFCNFVRNTPQFSRNGNGNAASNNRTNQPAGRATAREADYLAAMGGGAIGHLEKGRAAGPGRDTSGSPDIASPFGPGSETNPRPPLRSVG